MMIAVFLISILIRSLLMVLPSFTIDMTAWLAWAYRLAELGPGGFYSDTVWTQYTPGFLYWLWGIGRVGMVNEWAIKVPILICDVLTVYILFRVVKNKWVIPLYLLNPALAFSNGVWGQIDGLLTLLLVLSFYFGFEKKNLPFSAIVWSMAVLVKPQALAFAPVLAVLLIRNKRIPTVFLSILGSLGVLIMGSVLFFPQDPILGLPKLVVMMGQFYHYTSLYAYNIWALTTGMWKDDGAILAGLTYQMWGTVLYVLSILAATIAFFKSKKKQKEMYVYAALVLFSFFLFPTRVHERYLIPFFAFFLTFVFVSRKKSYIAIYIVSACLYLVNIYYPYAYYTESYLKSPALLSMIDRVMPLIVVSMVGLYVWLFTLLLKDRHV